MKSLWDRQVLQWQSFWLASNGMGVWESDEIEDRRGCRAVVSPSHPDSVFLYNKHIACYQLVCHEIPSVVKGEVKGDVR